MWPWWWNKNTTEEIKKKRSKEEEEERRGHFRNINILYAVVIIRQYCM